MSEDCSAPTDASLADSQPTHSNSLQSNPAARDERASITLYALVAVGLLAVGLVAAFVITGGVLDGDSPAGDVDGSEPTADTDPTPVDDGSDDNDSADPVQTPDDGEDNTTENPDDTDGTETGDSPTEDDEQTNSSDGDDDTSDDTDDGPAPPDEEEIYVEVEIQDLGFPEQGEMRLREAGTEDVVETHNFSEAGHNRDFEGLDSGKQYALTVETPYYPNETVRFRPDIKDTLELTVGYEFSSTDSYVIDWKVDYLPQYFDGDHTSEEAEEEAIPLTGVSRRDVQGNYYSAWDDPKIPGITQYYYNESTNRTFRNGENPSAEWERWNEYWGDVDNTRDTLIEKGLSGVEQRRFIRTVEAPGFADEYHVYEVPSDVFGAPGLVTVNPETGYPVKYEDQVEKMEDSEVTEEIAWFENLDEDITTKPSDFPEDKFDLSE